MINAKWETEVKKGNWIQSDVGYISKEWEAKSGKAEVRIFNQGTKFLGMRLINGKITKEVEYQLTCDLEGIFLNLY